MSKHREYLIYIVLLFIIIIPAYKMYSLPFFVDEDRFQKYDSQHLTNAPKMPLFYLPYWVNSDKNFLRGIVFLFYLFNLFMLGNLFKKNGITPYPLVFYPAILLTNFDNRGFYFMAENILGTILLYITYFNRSWIILILSLLIKPFAIAFLTLYKGVYKYLLLFIYIIVITVFYSRVAYQWLTSTGIYEIGAYMFRYLVMENTAFLSMFIYSVYITGTKDKNLMICLILLFLPSFLQPSHHHYLLTLFPTVFYISVSGFIKELSVKYK